ncbi:MAG: ATP-binding protein [Sedimentisphaerales bacterium]|nr:ATP-binding protein [Sedimentisphaerales bacterium]
MGNSTVAQGTAMTQTLRILAVDDEPGMQQGIARALRDYKLALPYMDMEVGFEIATTNNGETALELIERAAPDILLLDYKLPGISGLDVLEKLTPHKDEMVTIMVTAYASLETAITAIKRGAYDFLAKPFTPIELRNVVGKAARSIILAQQAKKLAEEKRQIRFQFISVLAHELKSPLAAVEGYLHIVKDRTAGDNQQTYDQMLDRSLVRLGGMRKLIGDLLDLTRIESGQKRRELTTIDIRKAAQAVIETFMPAANEHSVGIELKGDDTVCLNADGGEIEIILNNLISNAVKYNRDGGRVEVVLKSEPDSVTIIVSDTGIGVSQEEAARLFEDFVRIKNEKTRNILGSGLGLSIVKKLAILYHGDVSVQSVPDHGTTFTVVLKKE